MTGKDATEVLPPDDAGIDRAADILRAGGLVALPTETVYGLAGRADSDAAIAAIYRAKGRPDFNPLIVHIASLEQAEQLAVLDERARQLAERFWPGPLTMVLPLKQGATIAAAVTAGLPTIAIRMPAHPIAQALLKRSSLPLAAPSANRSGFVSPTQASHVLSTLNGRIDAVLDAGPCEKGLESTIVALRTDGSWQLLRHGPIDESLLINILGNPHDVTTAKIEAPGQLASHYAPGKPLRLNVEAAEEDEFLIGFGAIAGDCSLSETGDVMEAAARLYACLHWAADAPQAKIAVAPIPQEGVGAAIADRLARAAA